MNRSRFYSMQFSIFIDWILLVGGWDLLHEYATPFTKWVNGVLNLNDTSSNGLNRVLIFWTKLIKIFYGEGFADHWTECQPGMQVENK